MYYHSGRNVCLHILRKSYFHNSKVSWDFLGPYKYRTEHYETDIGNTIEKNI